MTIKIAAAQYDIGFFNHWREYRQNILRWIEEAVGEDAQLLLFPEYASMELASLFGQEIHASLTRQVAAMQTLLDDYLQLFQDHATKFGIHIVSGSFPVQTGSGRYRNRAYLFAPDGKVDFQEKLQMTRFEKERWLIEKGTEIKVFDTALGRIAINVCYDSEFPMFARKQVEAGADLLLVPSCTDTLRGYYRVRIGCQARALENQCYVVQSPTVGMASWSPTVDINIGAAAVYTPVDDGFPENGILQIGTLNHSQWLYADIDMVKLTKIRARGQVLNHRDWPDQFLIRSITAC